MGCGSSIDTNYVKVDQSIWRGTLNVVVKNAALHENRQLIGKQDPYCKLRFGRQLKQTKAHEDGGQFPVWNEEIQFKRTEEDDYVHVEIWNKNLIKDALIAEGGFSLTKVRKGGNLKLDQECNLYGNGKQLGVLHLSLAFDLDPACKNHPEVLAVDSTGKFNIWPKSATLQRDVSGIFSEMKPMVVVRLGDKEVSTAVDSHNKMNPKWSDQVVLNRDEIQRDTLMLEVRNFSESSEVNPLIGVGFIPFTPALLGTKLEKTVPLYYEGSFAGSITIEYQFQADGGRKAEETSRPAEQQKPVTHIQPNLQVQQQPQPQAQVIIAQQPQLVVQRPQQQQPVLIVHQQPQQHQQPQVMIISTQPHFQPQQPAIFIPNQQPMIIQQQQQLPASLGNQLQSGQVMNVNQCLWSANGRFYLQLQQDNNLVLFLAPGPFIQQPVSPIWSTNTVNYNGVSQLQLRPDGNVVLVQNGNPLWSTRTMNMGQAPHRFVLQDDGNLGLFDSFGNAVWYSGTARQF